MKKGNDWIEINKDPFKDNEKIMNNLIKMGEPIFPITHILNAYY